ncbi:11-beta-hydroxysteroid dehydrogenase 1B-like, partial [Chenopodium quinoa]|uniref:11-beta-hydroxysteroid dehydrogenase 1B-like n=1 Tax=Chenopodium quinoa TaxID=63459 RepID=UPI000B771D8B
MKNLINQILDVATSCLAFIALIFILPPFLCLKFFLSSLNFIFSENVSGKVVLITGASSGIGEFALPLCHSLTDDNMILTCFDPQIKHLAYEYARRGAKLALVARRRQRLQDVAETSRYLGAPDVLVISADVTKVGESKHFINETVNHFGGSSVYWFNPCIKPIQLILMIHHSWRSFQETNFWGSVYSTHFAIPHLKASRGKIIVTASSGAWLPVPRMAFYSASKAAVLSFFETLRVELGGDIGITIVTPGLTESELTKGKILSKDGKMVQISAVPVTSADRCAKAIIDSARRGDKYLTVPSWMRVTILWKVFLPEVLEWCNRMLLVAGPERPPTEAPSKKFLDLTGLQK